MEWIVWSQYAVPQTINPGENRVFVGMTTPDYSTVDPSALEAGAERDFTVHRTVGQVYGTPDPNNSVLWGWRLLPLQVNLATGDPDVPWSVTDSPLRSSDISNEPRWLDERWMEMLPALGIADGLDSYSHPSWTFVDCKAKMYCGPYTGEYPCIVVDNTLGVNPLRVTFRLRMLVYTQDRG